jgi:HPt (histidine-containing phosphotransfer) domain-containing protein
MTLQIVKIRIPPHEGEFPEVDRERSAAESFSIATAEDYAAAGEQLKRIVQLDQRFEDLFRESKASAHKTHAEICKAEKALRDPLATIRHILTTKRSSWREEQERIAQERQREADRLAAAAEEERRLLDAAAFAEDGNMEAADAVIDEPMPLAPVAVQTMPVVPMTAGVSAPVQRFTCVVENLGQLIAHVAAHPEWTHLLEPSTKELNKLASMQRRNFNLPGCRYAIGETESVRRNA